MSNPLRCDVHDQEYEEGHGCPKCHTLQGQPTRNARDSLLSHLDEHGLGDVFRAMCQRANGNPPPVSAYTVLQQTESGQPKWTHPSKLPPNQPGLYWVRTWQDGTEYDALVSITGATPFLAKRLVWSNQGFEHLGQLCIFAWGPRVEPPAIKEG